MFAVLRRRAELAWLADDAGPRALVLASLVRLDGWTPEAVADALEAGGRYGAAPPDPAERAMLTRVAGLDDGTPPDAAAANVPDWLLPELAAEFGGALAAETAALAGRAPLDLRVNRLKAGPGEALAALAADGIAAGPGHLCRDALRVEGRAAIRNARAFRDGLVEIQDQGSQAAALLADARPGRVVVDLCAGAGGKSLALAAAMADRGEIHAFDNDAARLARLGPRAARAGATCIAIHLRAAGAEPEVEALAGRADRVVVDAPCSGSGAWRRRPEEKWRLTPERLAVLSAVQDALLDTAATMVRPGGRLVYMTCSVLPSENGAAIARFRARRPDFAFAPVAGAWADHLPGAPPQPERPDLVLSPLRTDTDGFYVAILQRSA